MRTAPISAIALAVAMLPQADGDLAYRLRLSPEDLTSLRANPSSAGIMRRMVIANALREGANDTASPPAARALADQITTEAKFAYQAQLEAEVFAALSRGATPDQMERLVAESLAREMGPELWNQLGLSVAPTLPSETRL